MEKKARIAGYAVALAVLAGLLSLVALLREDVLFPHNRLQVAFPAVGTLMEDDPVTMHGVQVGRVAAIEAGKEGSIAILEFFHRTPIPSGSRFINYNYSLFGARMVILVPGESLEPMDVSAIQPGVFSSGVAESIHRVEELLVTMMEYKSLSARLEHGGDSSMSLQDLMESRIYPALGEFAALSRQLELVETAASAHLADLAEASVKVDRFGRDISSQSDSLISRANRTLLQLAEVTAQATVVLRSLERLMLASQDTTGLPSSLLVRRELYDKALTLTHTLRDLLEAWKKDGLKDIIHFWRNVHFRWRKSDR